MDFNTVQSLFRSTKELQGHQGIQ